MKSNEYKCAMCHGVFEKGWSEEEAKQECVDNFGAMMAEHEEMDIICDDCYKKIDPQNHPELVKVAVETFLAKVN